MKFIPMILSERGTERFRFRETADATVAEAEQRENMCASGGLCAAEMRAMRFDARRWMRAAEIYSNPRRQVKSSSYSPHKYKIAPL